jgi:hypothetical protein
MSKTRKDTVTTDSMVQPISSMVESSIKSSQKTNMNKKLPQMHNDEWVKYLEKNLIHIDGIIWADALLTHIQLQTTEINIKAQKFRSQMYYLKYQR